MDVQVVRELVVSEEKNPTHLVSEVLRLEKVFPFNNENSSDFTDFWMGPRTPRLL